MTATCFNFFKLFVGIYRGIGMSFATHFFERQASLGSQLMAELEWRVKAAGASCIELQAVKDEMHERFYGKAGFKDAKNFVMKVKWW